MSIDILGINAIYVL